MWHKPYAFILTGVATLLLLGNFIQYYSNVRQDNLAITDSMIRVVPNLHKSLTDYENGNLKSSAINFGVVGGELSSLAYIQPSERDKLMVISQYMIDNAENLSSVSAKGDQVLTFLKQADTVLQNEKKYKTYIPNHFSADISQLYKLVPGI